MKIQELSRVMIPGSDRNEDGLFFHLERDRFVTISILDGRRAWQENGNPAALMEAVPGAKTTGEACTKFCLQRLEEVGLWTEGVGQARTAMLHMNQRWGRLLTECGYDLAHPEGLPGAAGTVVRIDLQTGILDFAHALDTKLMIINDGEIYIPTVDYMTPLDKKVLYTAGANARYLGCSVRDAIYFNNLGKSYDDSPKLQDPIQMDIKHRKLENLSDGLAVINGMPELEGMMQTGRMMVTPGTVISLFTDGFVPPNSPVLSKLGQGMVEMNFNLLAIVEANRRKEDSDLQFNRYPRFAIHRDAAGIAMEIIN